jgi:hypothetical protein
MCEFARKSAKDFFGISYAALRIRSGQEKKAKAAGEGGRVAGLAFPKRERAVAEPAELAEGLDVAIFIAAEFGEPVFPAGRGNAAAARAGVHVPKAAVDQDDFAMTREDEVGAAPRAKPVLLRQGRGM